MSWRELREQARKLGINDGLAKGWRTYLWLLKILLPISLAVALLVWSGWLAGLDVVLKPAMGLLGLPPEAALVLLSGLAVGPGAAVGAMVVLPLTQAQMTLLAIFVLIIHALPQEATIQVKAGLRAWKAIGFRLAAASLTVWVAAQILDPQGSVELAQASIVPAARPDLGPFLLNWLREIARLAGIIFLLLMSFLVTLEVVRAKGLLEPLVRLISPLLKALGLSPRVGLAWVAAAIFGLAFSSAILMEEARSGRISPQEMEALHLSIGINHGFFDDPLLFVSLGLNVFWVYLPRLLAALIAVRLLTWWQQLARRRVAV